MNMTRRQALKSLVLGSGVVLSSASVLSVLNTAYASSKGTGFTPVFFTQEQAHSLALMTHVILPKSDSLPGAEDVPIVTFIDALYAQLMSEEERTKFIAGFDIARQQFESQYKTKMVNASKQDIQEYVSALYNKTSEQTEQILNMINAPSAPAGQEENYLLYVFLFNLRALTLEGYFESELVGENVLAYLPIPGPYEGEITIDENTRAWSI
jgi:hypothetical protein